MSKITNDIRLNPFWHRMLYSCTHMATVDVKGYDNINHVNKVWQITITISECNQTVTNGNSCWRLHRSYQ